MQDTLLDRDTVAERSRSSILLNLAHDIWTSVDTQSRAHRTFYMLDEVGVVRDVTEDGQLACAMYESRMLAPYACYGLIRYPQVNVDMMIRELMDCGWANKRPTDFPNNGISVGVWAAGTTSSGTTHKHTGFILSERGMHTAISHTDTKRCPEKHDGPYEYRGRPLMQVLTHPLLLPDGD